MKNRFNETEKYIYDIGKTERVYYSTHLRCNWRGKFNSTALNIVSLSLNSFYGVVMFILQA